MADHEKPLGPLDNRVAELIVVNAFLTVFATFFAVLRLVVVWRSKKRFMLSDYILMVAIVSPVHENSNHLHMRLYLDRFSRFEGIG